MPPADRRHPAPRVNTGAAALRRIEGRARPKRSGSAAKANRHAATAGGKLVGADGAIDTLAAVLRGHESGFTDRTGSSSRRGGQRHPVSGLQLKIDLDIRRPVNPFGGCENSQRNAFNRVKDQQPFTVSRRGLNRLPLAHTITPTAARTFAALVDGFGTSRQSPPVGKWKLFAKVLQGVKSRVGSSSG